MWTLHPSTPQKIGVIVYGLAVGVGMVLATSAALLLVGLAISLFAQSTGLLHLGEYGPWLPVIGAYFGFYLGIVVGAIACWKAIRSRLRGTPTQ